MNRTELIDSIAEHAELTKTIVTKIFDSTLFVIVRALQEDDPVVITGFGSFIVKFRAARIGYNPVTGKKIEIKKTKMIGFKPGKSLKDAIKRSKSENSKILETSDE